MGLSRDVRFGPLDVPLGGPADVARHLTSLVGSSEGFEADRAIVVVRQGDEGGGSVVGYDDPRAVVLDLLAHAEAHAKRLGLALVFHFEPIGGSDS